MSTSFPLKSIFLLRIFQTSFSKCDMKKFNRKNTKRKLSSQVELEFLWCVCVCKYYKPMHFVDNSCNNAMKFIQVQWNIQKKEGIRKGETNSWTLISTKIDVGHTDAQWKIDRKFYYCSNTGSEHLSRIQ